MATPRGGAADISGEGIFLTHKEKSWTRPPASIFDIGKKIKKVSGLLGDMGEDPKPAQVPHPSGD